MPKRSILFISTQLPFPPKSGGTIKSWNYLKDLSNRYEMGLACLLKEDDIEEVEAFKKSIQLNDFIYQELKVSRSPLTLIKSYLLSSSLNLYRNRSSRFKRKIAKLAGEYDALLIDHYEMFQYIPENYKGKVIMHTHNAEFALWKRMSELSNNPVYKLALALEAKRVKAYEEQMIERADLVYATPSDIETYQQAGIRSTKFKPTYHLGNDELLDLPELKYEQTEKCLLFMGTLSWEPNIDGILWFIDEVYPRLIQTQPELQLYILGKLSDDRLTDAAKKFPGIELCGFIEQIEDYLSKSRVFIVPLRFGSGMKVKVLEGMYRGLPMVCSSIGAEGLKVRNGEELMIANEAEEFSIKVNKLLEDRSLWEKLSKNSRDCARKHYTWKPLFDRMDIELKKHFT